MQRLEEERNALLRRMGDLSNYMKELKQWISRDYNKKVGRKGTLWEDRFWSCLLEDSATVLTQVAYYTYARFPKVFNARKRPAKPFVTDIGEVDDAICASHKPHRIGVG